MNHYPAYTRGHLDPQADALLTRIALAGERPTSALTPAQARAGFLDPAWLGAPRPMEEVRDLLVPGPAGPLRLRAYVPAGRSPHPVLLFFHGGGFVLGTLDEFDVFATRLAEGAGSLVLSVDYRLAPEHRFPAAADDAAAALRWAAAHAGEVGGDASRLAIAGDSAGANLAVVAALAARDDGGPPLRAQLLLSPWVDLSSTESESFRLFGDGRWLSTASLLWYRSHYLADPRDALLPNASPLLAPDLGGLPPTVILEAEFDVLRDQGRSLARRLEEGGCPVELLSREGTLHDFALLPGLFDQASAALDDVCAALRRAFREAH